ncbi:MAG: ABC transporter substrate-binding protein, partial [Chloroflexota bacterium]
YISTVVTCLEYKYKIMQGQAAQADDGSIVHGHADAPAAEASSEPIIIGHQPELTGPASIFGFWNDRAAQAAVKRINENGGIAGRPVELVTRDTGTNPEQGLDAFRRLVLEDNADFILGSIVAGVNKPSAALASELNTLYFPSDDVPVSEGQPEANRFVFRLGHNTRLKAQATYQWALDNLGTKWSFLTSDTTWGNDQMASFTSLIESSGGEVIDTVVAPLLTEDFVPLFNQIDLDETEVLYHSFFGSAAVRFNSQAITAGVYDKVKVFASMGVLEGVNPADVPDGQSYITEFPRNLDQIPEDLRGYNEELRALVGVDDIGIEIDGTNVLTEEHYWVPWVNINLLKIAIEGSGWQSKDDNIALIEFMEGYEAKASLDFPSGDFVIRPEDHRAFRDYFVEQTNGGLLEVVERFPKEMGMYDPPVDYTAQ